MHTIVQGAPCGYFGKVPTHGDFVSNSLDQGVTGPLDAWLHASIQVSQRHLGRDWLKTFLVAPVWHFALAAQVCGPRPVIGVMVPNVDRVGRYFPLVLATTLQDRSLTPDQMASVPAWYRHATELALSTLDPDFNFDRFDAASAELIAPAISAPTSEPTEKQTLWWTDGAEHQQPIAYEWIGLPPADAFTTLLQPAADAQPEHPAATTADAQLAPASVIAAACSIKGTRKVHNTDAWTIGPNADLFAVVDGIEDTSRCAAAMQDVAQTLSSADAPFSMNDLVAEAKGKLGKAHMFLRNRSQSTGEPFSASVVVLLVQARRYAVLWAGNARCHLMRASTVRDLTRDHTDQRNLPVMHRALGGTGALMPDSAIGTIEPGDRFLLCTEGVSSTLERHEIADVLAREGNATDAATGIAQDAIIAGTPNDATALAVFVAGEAASVS